MAAGVCSAVSPPIETSAVAAGTVQSREYMSSYELARMVSPTDLTLSSMDKLMSGALHDALKTDPDMAALEKDYPGITAAMINAMRPIMLKDISDTLPDLWDAMAHIYARGLKLPEIAECIAFFKTEAGRILVRQMHDNYKGTNLMAEIVANPDAPPSNATARKDDIEAATVAIGAMSTEHKAQFGKFAFGPTGTKLRALAGEIAKATQEWENKENPALDAALEKAATEALAKYQANFKRKREFID